MHMEELDESGKKSMSVTVVVCTYNRCQALAKALDSIAVQVMPKSVFWDVLIVDNNSSDKTREISEKYCRENPDLFSYIFEPKQGLSQARNTGIQKSRGGIVAFTDDDAVVEPNWLWNLTRALHDGEWAGAGGRIIPVWDGPIPNWLSNEDIEKIGTFGGFDEGPEPVALERPPYGGNIAFRREAFERYGGFRVDLGRTGGNLQGREDIELANRLFAHGERLRYEPGAVIRHPVTENRMKKSYVLRWFYWDSRSEIVDDYSLEAGASIRGVPLYLFRRLIRWVLQWTVSFSARRRFFCECQMWKVAGYIAGCYCGTFDRDQKKPVSQADVTGRAVQPQQRSGTADSN